MAVVAERALESTNPATLEPVHARGVAAKAAGVWAHRRGALHLGRRYVSGS